MNRAAEISRRVTAIPDYARYRREAEDAHSAIRAAVVNGDGEAYLGAQLVMKGACDAITELYDRVTAEMGATS